LDGRRQQDLAYRHHGPLAASAGGGRLKDASKKIKSGAHILLDGYNGSVIVNPTDQTLFEYGQLVRRQASIEEKLRAIQSWPPSRWTGRKSRFRPTSSRAATSRRSRSLARKGVGLFRTEYLFINRDTLPTRRSNTRLTGRWRRR
jgi:phosphoenolpyruvate-protein phosphotransferase (PTS system enzyme I)